jgi:hypothetical protein
VDAQSVKRRGLLGLGLTSPFLAACSSSSVAEPRRPITYYCAHHNVLQVHAGVKRARVEYLNRHYELAYRSSSLGRRYTSNDATLIIDGDSVVFVNHRNMDLQTCHAVTSSAS